MSSIDARPGISRDRFAEQVHSTFTIALDGGATVAAELAEVSEHRRSGGYEQFSLLFSAPADMPPVQRTYELEHPELGSLQLFLVPVARDESGLRLQAVFARQAAQMPSEG